MRQQLRKRPVASAPRRVKRKRLMAQDAQSDDDLDFEPSEGDMDAAIRAEDMEIKRLERLLGIKKSGRKESAKKLNKEYAEFEGIEGDFGDFLLGLDSLVESVTERKGTNESGIDGKGKNTASSSSLDDDNGDEVDNSEVDDIEQIEDGEEEEDDDDDDESISEESDISDTHADSASDSAAVRHTYHPTQGEDIYGRIIDPPATSSSSAPAKYVPPSRRVAAPTDQVLKHKVTGLLNKLSESSRDYLLKELVGLFRDHSTLECTELVLQHIFATSCVQHSAMTSYIPLQMTLVCALHIVVGQDIGATLVEKLVQKIVDCVQGFPPSMFSSEGTPPVSSAQQTSTSAHCVSAHTVGQEESSSNKIPHNCLLMLVCLYNCKVLHHTLILDWLLALVAPPAPPSAAAASLPPSAPSAFPQVLRQLDATYRMELVELLVQHAGMTLRTEDPEKMALVSQSIQQSLDSAHSTQTPATPRLVFMLEFLSDLRQGRLRKLMLTWQEEVKAHRKYLGQVKTSFGKTSHLLVPLRVSLSDLLDVDRRGRWWKLGAFYSNSHGPSPGHGPGKTETSPPPSSSSSSTAAAAAAAASSSAKLSSATDRCVAQLSDKLKLTTSTRKLILKQLLLARDVHDAYERIVNLNLSVKEDREIVRVLIECCGKEPVYNPFYTEVIKMLCEGNRQYKLSVQYALWDILKVIAAAAPEEASTSRPLSEQYMMNIAQLMAQLVLGFVLSLGVIRPVDMAELNARSVLFLSTFFLTLFQDRTDMDSFTSLFDRLSTAKDFQEVHGKIVYFLETILAELPDRLLTPEDRKHVKQRKAAALKILRQMKSAFMV